MVARATRTPSGRSATCLGGSSAERGANVVSTFGPVGGSGTYAACRLDAVEQTGAKHLGSAIVRQDLVLSLKCPSI